MPGKYADGVYGHKPWDKDRPGLYAPEEAAFPPQEYLGPFQSNQDRLLNQSLATWTMSSEEIQAYVRPNLPQINLFPPRYGYVTEEIGIQDIIELPGRNQNQVGQRVESDYSNTPNTTQSTSRNTLGGSV
jgi:hypothetical protein